MTSRTRSSRSQAVPTGRGRSLTRLVDHDDGVTANRRTLEKEATRAKILAAARRLFVKHGFENVSMRQIAAAIRYTPGSLYVHFHDKLELIYAMMMQDFAAFDAGLASAMQISDPVERLRELGRGYVRFALAHPHHYKLMFMTEPPDLGEKKRLDDNCPHASSDREGYNMCRLTVAECIQQGRFGPMHRDPELVSQATWGCVHGVVSLFITHGKQPWTRFEDPLHAADLLIESHLAGMTRGARVPTTYAPVEPNDARSTP